MLHLLIYRILSFLFTKYFCIIAVVQQRLLISKAAFMLLIKQQKWHFWVLWVLTFSTDISGILGGLNSADAW